MELNANLRIGTAEFLDANKELPEWIAFLLWTGWWMRLKSRPDVRLHLVALLPSRSCCAAIAAFGAQIAATQEEPSGLNFRDFMALPDGTPVSLHKSNQMFQGVLGPCDRYVGQSGRKVSLVTNLKKWKSSAIWIFETNLREHQISTDNKVNPSSHLLKHLARIESFYSNLNPRAKSGWCLSTSREVLIVTSYKAAWRREVEGVSGQIDFEGNTTTESLADLIVTTDEPHGFPCKTLLAKPSGLSDGKSSARTAILDGPDAIRIAEQVDADAILMLLEHSEYDENVVHEIASMADVRDDHAVPTDLPNGLPNGVEASIFGWMKQQ